MQDVRSERAVFSSFRFEQGGPCWCCSAAASRQMSAMSARRRRETATAAAAATLAGGGDSPFATSARTALSGVLERGYACDTTRYALAVLQICRKQGGPVVMKVLMLVR